MTTPLHTAIYAALSISLSAYVAMAHALAPSDAGERTCWARVYTNAHIRSHPGQEVKEMLVRLARPSAFPAQVSTLLRVRFQDEPSRVYLGSGTCRTEGSETDCWIDGDGGRFTLEERSGGRIVLINNNAGGLALDRAAIGGQRAIRRLTDHPQHGIFLLHRVDESVCPDDWLG
jgi:hypothetical protein